jgi:hypothetical protein
MARKTAAKPKVPPTKTTRTPAELPKVPPKKPAGTTVALPKGPQNKPAGTSVALPKLPPTKTTGTTEVNPKLPPKRRTGTTVELPKVPPTKTPNTADGKEKASPAWTLTNVNAKEAGGLEAAGKKNFNDWAGAVSNGVHPKKAAEGWDSSYKVIKKDNIMVDGKSIKADFCTIRLSQSNRVYFYQYPVGSTNVVKVVKLGDHAAPRGWTSPKA